ncbi:hypothetical protein S58_38970 [Bradyrhizobium oligotrophicum S58]|uniref:Uncharacterized protein n=1 Tax=Bradyrhizobium oligotrophicum S58 TaxID=1245469 RepID=M4Z9C1_9BRAD|nr:hypothetical protein [Bradyrhizobium oligotrophicum]BAM89886.1 hypothetical protein S58_38970 [Bradyrhizobium oligotrophicum S58]
MPAPESFVTIVDTLAGVRRDYHEKLKSIPQYEAFLLIESSTEKAAGALHGTDASSSSIATDVIDSLQYARTRFEQHMASIPEYRVLMAIDKVIKEISQHLGLAAKDDAAPEQNAAAASDDQAPDTAAAVASAEAETADESAPSEPEAEQESDEPGNVEAEIAEQAAVEPMEAEAPTLRVVEAPVKSPSIVPADHDADAAHDDDIVVLNAPTWEKSGRDAKDDITARLAAQAASAAANDTDDSHDLADTDLVMVSQREPSDHEAA